MAWTRTAVGTLTWSGMQPAWRTRASLVMNTTRWSTGRSQIMHRTRWWTIVEEAMIVIRPAWSSMRVSSLTAGTRSLPGFGGSGPGAAPVPGVMARRWAADAIRSSAIRSATSAVGAPSARARRKMSRSASATPCTDTSSRSGE